MPNGGGGGGSQTVTNVQQIPQFEQDFAQQNQDLARSLASQPYPQYQGPLVAGFTPGQTAGQQMASQAATAYQPALQQAMGITSNAAGQNTLQQMLPMLGQSADMIQYSGQTNPMVGNGAGMIAGSAANTAANPGVISSYMNPYVGAALQPQIDTLNQQVAQQQLRNDAASTQAGAFGDARSGVAEGLTNRYGQQALRDIVSGGYNQAYNTAMQAAQNQQQMGISAGNALAGIGAQQQGLGLQAGQALGQLGLGTVNAGMQQQGVNLGAAQQLANMGGLAQSLGLQGANALYNAGSQQQQLQQQMLNTAYQQYQNQVNWPFQMENVRLSALSNSPYSITNSTTLPAANMTAQNLGGLASVAGLLGSLGGGSTAPFGGSAYNPATAKVG